MISGELYDLNGNFFKEINIEPNNLCLNYDTNKYYLIFYYEPIGFKIISPNEIIDSHNIINNINMFYGNLLYLKNNFLNKNKSKQHEDIHKLFDNYFEFMKTYKSNIFVKIYKKYIGNDDFFINY